MNPPSDLVFSTVGDFEMLGGTLKDIRATHADVAGLKRFRVGSEVDEAGFLDSIHRKIQEGFSPLIRQVGDRHPGLRWAGGRSEGGVLLLFSYVTFPRLDDDDGDPVIVGIAVARRGSEIRITGDISGDESGHIFFDEDCEGLVPSEQGAVEVEALRIATILSSRGEVVIHAIESR